MAPTATIVTAGTGTGDQGPGRRQTTAGTGQAKCGTNDKEAAHAKPQGNARLFVFDEKRGSCLAAWREAVFVVNGIRSRHHGPGRAGLAASTPIIHLTKQPPAGWNGRKVMDGNRAVRAIRGAEGKTFAYRQATEAS